jgi:predicted RNA-binding Zn ribbon-like protein
VTIPGPTTASVLAAQLVEELETAYPGGQRLRVLLDLRELIEDQVAAEVQTMRTRHATWEDIGQLLGVSKQAAWARYGRP